MPVLEQACPEVEAGGVDNRLQVVVRGHKLWQRALAVLGLHWERLPENHGEALLRGRNRSGKGFRQALCGPYPRCMGTLLAVPGRYSDKSQTANGTELAPPPVTEHA